MGRLTELCEDYRDHDITLEELTDAILVFDFKPTGLAEADCKGDPDCIDEHLFDDPTDTWDEVKRCHAQGMLTNEDMDTIARAQVEHYASA